MIKIKLKKKVYIINVSKSMIVFLNVYLFVVNIICKRRKLNVIK